MIPERLASRAQFEAGGATVEAQLDWLLSRSSNNLTTGRRDMRRLRTKRSYKEHANFDWYPRLGRAEERRALKRLEDASYTAGLQDLSDE